MYHLTSWNSVKLHTAMGARTHIFTQITVTAIRNLLPYYTHTSDTHPSDRLSKLYNNVHSWMIMLRTIYPSISDSRMTQSQFCTKWSDCAFGKKKDLFATDSIFNSLTEQCHLVDKDQWCKQCSMCCWPFKQYPFSLWWMMSWPFYIQSMVLTQTEILVQLIHTFIKQAIPDIRNTIPYMHA